jgi:hypothetical protein
VPLSRRAAEGPCGARRAGAARYYLEEVLRRHGGNVAEAAAHGGVDRESYRLLRRFGANVDERRACETAGRRPEG